ncbi:MAG: TrkA family potassium uptake protein, partial [Acidobacteriota bacterium]|nr:TrkA family potassium uptake protein [Acidobacteriota bacterium]
MGKPWQRLLLLVVGLFASLLLATFLYQWGMKELEGEPRSFWRSLEWASETITTTGYGRDAQWTHPGMVIFVSAVQFFGVFLIFL